MSQIKEKIQKLVYEYEYPRRIAISRRYPQIKGIVLFVRRTLRNIGNIFNLRIRKRIIKEYYTCVLARHQSLLRRRLGDSSPRLQEQKIINLQQAVKKLDGIVIKPGEIFSLWHIVGKPSYRAGYVDGMLLSNGKVVEGLGGGMCQLSNFLFWIFLHTNIEIVERYHHSRDVFPDSGRTLPFGSGATILYNFVDLKVKNVSEHPLQLKIWVTDKHLKGQIVSPERASSKFHIREKNHLFVKKDETYFRYNEIYKEERVEGEIIKTENITTNFAPVLYTVDDKYIEKNGFSVLEV